MDVWLRIQLSLATQVRLGHVIICKKIYMFFYINKIIFFSCGQLVVVQKAKRNTLGTVTFSFHMKYSI